MDEHRNVEVAVREHFCNMPKEHPNVVAAAGVLGVVGFYLNHAAVRLQQEVMRSGSLGKTMKRKARDSLIGCSDGIT